jgi:hypothetical protein
MSLRWCSVAVLVLVGLQISTAGQNPGTPNPNEASGVTRSAPAGALSGIMGVDTQSEGESREDLPQIPSMLGGPGSSLAFLSEMQRTNYLRGGVNLGAAYDGNALLAPSGQVGNMTYSVFPSVALDQSTSRMRWTLGYGVGLTVNQRLSNQNQGSHNLNFDSEFRLSPHVNLRAAENFSLTAGMFGANGGPGLQPGLGGPNGTLITPLANIRSSQTVVETHYHFARKDAIGASGSLYDLHYSDVTTGAGSLVDTRVAAGSGFWLHEIFHGDWAGVGYRFQRMTYGPIGETRVHSLTVVNTLSLSRAFTLSAFIGPEYSDNYGIAAMGPNAGQVTSFSDWSTAGGVDLGWQKQRTSLSAGYSKQVSNGSGIVGAVRLENIHGSFRRELLPGWAAAVTATYGNNESLTLASANTATSIKTTSVGASLERNIGRSLGLQFGYFHDIQNQSGSNTPSLNYDANRNRLSVTLSYQWAKPLGR